MGIRLYTYIVEDPKAKFWVAQMVLKYYFRNLETIIYSNTDSKYIFGVNVVNIGSGG